MKLLKGLCLVLLAGLLLQGNALESSVWAGAADSFAGEVVSVVDGDTLKVLRAGEQVRIRLAGIDCPELKGQDFGHAAKTFVLEQAARKTVRVQQVDTDRYGRVVAEVFLPDGRSLNRLLIEKGLAWWYRAYSTDQSLGDLEEQARQNRLGLWSMPEPVPPWDYRRHSRK